MHVYPNPDSWDEFYPSEIFIALAKGESQSDLVSMLAKAQIGANIVVGTGASSSITYKKVGEIAVLADVGTSLIFLGQAVSSNG